MALKLQDKDDECPTNKYERGFYPSLQGGIGMPTLWSAGIEGRWDYLAIDLLGSSLHSLYWKSGKNTMDLRSVCCIAMQVVRSHFFFGGEYINIHIVDAIDCKIRVYAFKRDITSGYTAGELCGGVAAERDDDLHDRFWVFEEIYRSDYKAAYTG